MPPTITGLTYGTISWNVAQMIADTVDAGPDPDVVGITGTVNITANVDDVILATGSTPPVTLFNGPYALTIVDGVMQDDEGRTAIELVATDCAVLNPVNFTYHVKFKINNNGNLKRGEFDFSLPGGSTVDLTTVSPVPGTTGDPIIQGPAGPTGPGAVITGTSTTSTTIGTGSKTFTTQSGVTSFILGQFLRIASSANGANYMGGTVTAYSGTSLTVNVTETGGSGTFAAWNIVPSGVKGNTGSTGSTGPTPAVSGTSTTSLTPGTGSKVFTTQASVPVFTVGNYVRAASSGTPADFMSGFITAYSGTSLTVNVDTFSGSTAHTDWNISLSGAPGPTGPPGSGSADATTTSKGSVKLAGDLSGTADLPTVTGGTHHTHTSSQITDKGAASGVASLDGSALVPVAQIPPLAHTQVSDWDDAVADSLDVIIVDGTNITTGYDNVNHQLTISAAGITTVTYDQMASNTLVVVPKNGDGTWPDRPTDRTDIICAWLGAEPSPDIVESGTLGMLDNVDLRWIV